MAEDDRPARPPPPKPSMSRTFIFMMFFLTLFVIIDPNLRTMFGLAAGAVFDPTIGLGWAYPVGTILLAGSLTTTISSIVRHFFTDWVRMTRMNKQMGALRKAQMDALRKGNPGKVQKLREATMKLQQENLDVQFSPMKSMAVTFLMFIVFFAWLASFIGRAVSLGHAYFAVPWQFNVDLNAAYLLPAWILLYSLFAIPIGQVVGRVLKLYSFRKRLAKLEAQGD